jgi:arylsulfatase A-like enzyme
VLSDRPNILIFNPDQFRADALGHMGNPAAATPVMDRFAREEGVSFRWAFCQNPVCTPSRCSFMSGWYTHVHGHRTMWHMLRPGEDPNLLRTLKDSGYYVWWGGKNDLVPGQLGWEPYCNEKALPSPRVRPGLHADQSWRSAAGSTDYYSFYAGRLDTGADAVYWDSDWDYVKQAMDFIHRYDRDEPFCLYLPLLYPHPPYGVEDPWYSRIDRSLVPPRIPTPESWDGLPSLMKGLVEGQGLQSWSEERWIELRATYYGMCARIDHQFGMLLDALRDAGLYDRTAVFCFSDHGDYTGDYGIVEKAQNTFQDCLVRVPFLMKPPAGVAVRARTSEALVELIDFAATVEDLARIAPSHTHFGRSLLPLLGGVVDEHRDAVFCEGGRLRGERHCMELESTSAGAPEGLYHPRLRLQAREGGEHTKAVMCRSRRYKYVMRLYESDELYDLENDPCEQDNRIDDSCLVTELATLKERLLRFYLETGDVVPQDIDQRNFLG